MKMKKVLLILFAITMLITSSTLIEASSEVTSTVVQVDLPVFGIWVNAATHYKSTTHNQEVDLFYVEKDEREICVDLIYFDTYQETSHCGFEGDTLLYEGDDYELEGFDYYYYAKTKSGYWNKTLISTGWTFD